MARSPWELELEARCRDFARELTELVRRAVFGAVDDALRDFEPKAPVRQLPGSRPTRPGPRRAPAAEPGAPRTLADYERMALERALTEAGGHVQSAAKLLGLTKSAMYRRTRQAGIPVGWRPDGRTDFKAAGEPLSLVRYERMAIERALGETGGDKTAAAKLLGVSKATFYRKLRRSG